MFKITWIDNRNGICGESKEPMNLQIANSWIEPLNEKYPYIKHSLKRVN
jgi:hypothetical protein